jgi:hypothetical protein
LWGVAVLLTGLADLTWPGYGRAFLQLVASLYPGYNASGSIGDLILGVLWALADGALFGLFFALLYNRFLAQGRDVDVRCQRVDSSGLTS